MKRTFRIILIALLCLMMALPAGAAANRYRGAVQAQSFIDGTNLLRDERENGNFVTDIDASMSHGAYDHFQSCEGYVQTSYSLAGESHNRYGLLGPDGRPVVDFRYFDIRVWGGFAVAVIAEPGTEEDHDYEDYNGNYYVRSLIDIYNLKKGERIGQLSRSQYAYSYVFNGCINIEDTNGVVTTHDGDFNVLGTASSLEDETYMYAGTHAPYEDDNGLWGMRGPDGSTVLAPAFKSMYAMSCNFYRVTRDGKVGLVSNDGKLVVPAEYDSVEALRYQPAREENNYSTYGYRALDMYYCVVKDGKICFLDNSGNITNATNYTLDDVSYFGACLMLENGDGSVTLVAADGAENTVSGYESVDEMENCSGMYFSVTNAEYKYGIIDWHGNVVMPCEYADISVSGDGRWILLTKDYEDYELYELTYSEGIPLSDVISLTGASAQSAPAQEAPAEEPVIENIPAEEIPAEETPEETTPVENAPADTAPEQNAPAGSDNASAAADLIETALNLLNVDPAAGSQTAIGLLSGAELLLTGHSAAGFVTGAATLLNSDPVANCAAAISLLQTALTQLGG